MPVVVSVVATWLAGWLLVVQGAVSPATGGRSIALHRLTLAAYPWIGFAVLLAWIMFRTGMDTIMEGLLLALMLWVGFVSAVAGHMFAFRSFNLRFFVTTAGSVLFALVINGVILGALIPLP